MYPSEETERLDLIGKLQVTAYTYDPTWAWHEGLPQSKIFVSDELRLTAWTPNSGANAGKLVPIEDSLSSSAIKALVAQAKKEGFGCVHNTQPAIIIDYRPCDARSERKHTFTCRIF